MGRARGDWLVFLGDDTVPEADFLVEHLRARGGVEKGADRVVAIGYTPWAREYLRTRFMEYVGEEGWQFGFSLIEDKSAVPFNFFYTSNLSISREFFRESGGFDEDFGEYGWEDIELGWRLHRMGMRLVYHPRAVAYHHHPTSVRAFVRRQRRVGASAWNFYRKHPEMADFPQRRPPAPLPAPGPDPHGASDLDLRVDREEALARPEFFLSRPHELPLQFGVASRPAGGTVDMPSAYDPRLTVIIPTWNRARLLERCLSSLADSG